MRARFERPEFLHASGRVAGAVALVLALARCGPAPESATETGALVLLVDAGANQTALAGQNVPVQPSVTVSNNGHLAPGVTVTFAVTAGGGSVSSSQSVSNANGIATVTGWKLGSTPGTNSLTASVAGGNSVVFTATGTVGAAAAASKSGGDAQTAAVGSSLATKPAVLVVDAAGNPVPGVAVGFALSGGGGSITGASVTTGSNGIATLGGWTLGNIIGPNTVVATVAGTGITGNSLTFTATGTAGPVATITKINGDFFSAPVSSITGTSPTVRLADQFGNIVAGQTVTFAITSGGGTITGATQTSGVNGTAALGSWTLGAVAGTNTLTASSGSAPPVTFTATGTAVAPTTLNVTGTWSGVWTDTRYNVSGTLTNVVLNQSATALNGLGTIDLSSLGLGSQSGTATGTLANGKISFTFASSGVGNGLGTLDIFNGAGSGSGSVSALSLGAFTYTGTVTATRITGTFQFTSPTGGNGTMTLNKQ